MTAHNNAADTKSALPSMVRATFAGSLGATLAGRLDLPTGPVRAYALFAHCFTCSKDILAARRIAAELTQHGIAVLRFDFTGLGHSEGEFASTSFSCNVDDLVLAADWLRQNYAPPTLLIGHSLGGAAVLASAHRIPEAKAVVTIGAPADVAHVLERFGLALDVIRDEGEASVELGGRTFTVRRSFLEDAESHRLAEHVANLRKALLVLHAPRDSEVGIDNATRIFIAAKHPKSFASLDDADHLLTRPADAAYAARLIAAWASRYVPLAQAETADHDAVLVRETGQGKFQSTVVAGRHRLLTDEPTTVGGDDTGPSPYDYLSVALGACTVMTIRLYAAHKKLALGRISVEVRHGKVPAEHCADCGEAAFEGTGKIDRFERIISVEGELDPALRDKLVEIAGKCPVHRTLEARAAVVTRLA